MTILPEVEELVRRIHAAPNRIVLALNGGRRAIAELLEVPGGSKALLDAVVPYSEGAITEWLGSRPEQFCSSRAARAMAVVAYDRALRYGAAEEQAVGIACSGSAARIPRGCLLDGTPQGSDVAGLAYVIPILVIKI
jgi:nicotinamide mononucleotide (NMN) deamidase PncC